MIPRIFPVVASDPACRQHLGADPVRFYPFGFAEQGAPKPYAVWQVIGGRPENPITCAPDVDNYLVQIDVYSTEAQSGLDAAGALRQALEKVCYVTSWRGQSRDPETKDFRVSFDVSFTQER